MVEHNNLMRILGCAISVQDGKGAAILIRRTNKYEKMKLIEEIDGTNKLEYSELTQERYILNLENLPKPYLMGAEK